MQNLLRIDVSPRCADKSGRTQSISRSLAAEFEHQLRANGHALTVTHRDLTQTSLRFVDQEWIAAAFTPEKQRSERQSEALQLSDALIKELAVADVVLISTPMYNYGIPASLKAWFDQVIRINKTFTFDLARGDFPLAPILSGKSLVLIVSCGEFGFDIGEIRGMYNHLTPHVKTMSKYLGVEDFYEIRVEYQEFGDDRHQASIKKALLDIEALAVQFVPSVAENN